MTTEAQNPSEPLTRERAVAFLLSHCDDTPEGAAAARSEAAPEQKEEFVEYIPMILKAIEIFREIIKRRRGG